MKKKRKRRREEQKEGEKVAQKIRVNEETETMTFGYSQTYRETNRQRQRDKCSMRGGGNRAKDTDKRMETKNQERQVRGSHGRASICHPSVLSISHAGKVYVNQGRTGRESKISARRKEAKEDVQEEMKEK